MQRSRAVTGWLLYANNQGKKNRGGRGCNVPARSGLFFLRVQHERAGKKRKKIQMKQCQWIENQTRAAGDATFPSGYWLIALCK